MRTGLGEPRRLETVSSFLASAISSPNLRVRASGDADAAPSSSPAIALARELKRGPSAPEIDERWTSPRIEPFRVPSGGS